VKFRLQRVVGLGRRGGAFGIYIVGLFSEKQ